MRISRAFCLCLLLAALSSALPTARADFETPIALTHAKIVTASGEVIDDGTILIENQRIKAVGADVEIPPHAEILDATDLIVYPGFIDANTHMGITRKEPSADERARVEDEWADVSQGPHSSTAQAFRRLIDDFCLAVRGEKESLISPQDTLASVEAIEAAYESLRVDNWTPVGRQGRTAPATPLSARSGPA